MEDIFFKHDLMLGRMIGGSKSLYKKSKPNNFIVFNANILTKENGKIWYGDLDITIDENKLKEVGKEINKVLYVLREMDCRFENENNSVDDLIKKAVWSSDKGDLRDNG